MVLHGRGDQYKLTKEYQELRNEGLLDESDLTEEEKIDADIEFPDGTGRTDSDKLYKFKSLPLNPDRERITIDIRDIPRYSIG